MPPNDLKCSILMRKLACVDPRNYCSFATHLNLRRPFGKLLQWVNRPQTFRESIPCFLGCNSIRIGRFQMCNLSLSKKSLEFAIVLRKTIPELRSSLDSTPLSNPQPKWPRKSDFRPSQIHRNLLDSIQIRTLRVLVNQNLRVSTWVPTHFGQKYCSFDWSRKSLFGMCYGWLDQ